MAEITSLGIDGAWLLKASVHGDKRGYFREWYRGEEFKAITGREFQVLQANISRSSKGVIRGIHYSLAKAGQAKLVTCSNGRIWDVIVDIRPGSPTFKKWVGVELKADEGTSIFIPEGLGHAFLALEDESVITYLLSSPYSPTEEFVINPKDPEIGINWPLANLSFSARDESAPLLKDARI